MLYCVFTPFKVGSQTLANTLRKAGVDVLKTHSPDEVPQEGPITFFLPLRPDGERYLSAFFAGIDDPSYPYAYADRMSKVLGAPVDDVVAHFLKQDWKAYSWLSYWDVMETIEKRIGGRPWTKFNQEDDWKIYRGPTGTLVLFHLEKLTRVLPEICKELDMPPVVEIVQSGKCAHTPLYKQVRTLLPATYFMDHSGIDGVNGNVDDTVPEL